MVDVLGSEYSWTKEYILDYVSIGDWLGLADYIADRKRRDYLLQLAIVQNPHTENPRALFDELQRTGEYDIESKIDRGGVEKLKRELKKSKVVGVKK